MGRITFWLGAMRAPFFVAVIIPVFLGTAIAWSSHGVFHWGYFLLTLLGVVCVNGGTNFTNDYFDHKSGCDDINREFISPFTGGSRMIQKDLLTPGQVLGAGIAFFVAASLLGLFLVWTRGLGILVIGAIGVFSGYFYTSPPFKLGYRWSAELIPGLNCGILVTLGAYWVQAQSFSWQPVVAAIPLAIIISAVLWVNEIPDYTADKAVGKNHLVVYLGKERAARGYSILMVLTYTAVVLGVILGSIPPLALLGLLTIPLAARAAMVVWRHYAEVALLAPANAATPMIYLSTGLLLTVGFILDRII